MSKKCQSLFDNKTFVNLLNAHLSDDFIEESVLTNSNLIYIKLLDLIKLFAKSNDFNLTNINQEDLNIIQQKIYSVLGDYNELSIVTQQVSNLNILLDPNFEAKYVKLKNPRNQEEATEASSFISEKLGSNIRSREFQQGVQNDLFKCLIWNKSEGNFVTSLTDIHKNIQNYLNQIKTSFKGDSFNKKQKSFLEIISSNINLAEAFSINNPNIFNNETCTIEEFKNLFKLNYLDYFIQKDFEGYLEIDPEKFNDFSDVALENKYKSSSNSSTFYFKEEEFIDLNKNTENLIKLFINNFSLYSYETGNKLNINFSLNTWHEANRTILNWIPEITKKHFTLNKEYTNDKGIIIEGEERTLLNILKTKFKSEADQIVLNELNDVADIFSVADFINRLGEHPDFYLKYFLYSILLNDSGTGIDPTKLATYEDTQSSILINKNRYNLVYSLYKNLFEDTVFDDGTMEYCITSSENKIKHQLINTPKFFSSLTQNLLSDKDMGLLEFDTTQNQLVQVDIRDLGSQQFRRDLENNINAQNIVEDTKISFNDWISSLNLLAEDFKGENLKEENATLTFTLKFPVNDTEKIEVKFSTNSKENIVTSKELNQLKNNEKFNKFLYILLGLEVTTKPELKDALFASKDNLQDLKSLCIGALVSQFLQRTPNAKEFVSVKLSSNNYYGTYSAVSESSLKTSIIKIADVLANLKTSFSSSIMDAGKNLVSTATEGNIGSSPRQYPSRSKLKKAPTAEFTIFKEEAGYETKTIRDIKLPNGTNQLWKNTSFSEMFTFAFLTEFIGGFQNTKTYSYSSTNGKKIGCPSVVNSDKTAFYQSFIDTVAKLFNNKDIKEAKTEDIQIQFYKDFQKFYLNVEKQLIDQYKVDAGLLNKFYKTRKKIFPNPSLVEIVDFYKTNQQAIYEYNISRDRITPIIEVTDVLQGKVNELFRAESKKFLSFDKNNNEDLTSYNRAVRYGNIAFVHTLMKKGTIIPLASINEDDPQATLCNLLKNDIYNYDLISIKGKDPIPEGYTEININNSFYPKQEGVKYLINKNYKKKDYLYKKTSDNTPIQGYKQYGKSSSYMPLFNISFEDKINTDDGKAIKITRHFTITSDKDFSNFLKAYKKAGYNTTGLKNHPFKLLRKGLNVIINPLLEKYNAFATLMSQEYITSQVGINIAHPAKGAPSFSDFQKIYQDDGFSEDELKAMYHEVLIGYCDKAQQKRNTNNTAQMKRLNRDVLTGVNSKMKVALISDPKTLGFSPNGSTGTIKVLDGSTFQTYTCALALNESFCASKVGLETMKLYNAIFIDKYGIGSNNKTANFTITNEKMRKDEFYQRMFFNMTKLPWRKANGEKFIPTDLFTSDITGNSILSYQIPFYYEVDGQWYARYYEGFAKDANGNIIYNEGNPVYQFRDYFCDEYATISDDDEGTAVQATFEDNFEIFLALGAWNSGELKNGVLTHSNWSLEKLFEIQCYNTEDQKTGKYKCEVFQPLLHSDIYMTITEGAVKMTHTNKMNADVLDQSIYDSEDNFKKSSFYNFFEQDTENLGVQLDKDHHADDSETSNATQVISACISQGYTTRQALAVYNALGSFSKINTKLFRTEDLVEITSDDDAIEEALYKTVIEFVEKNKEQESGTLLDYLTRDFIKKVKENPKIKFKEVSDNLPIDSVAIYKKVHSIISSTLTKAGIKLKVKGTLSVINPTQPAVKYYRVPIVRPSKLNQEWLDNFQQKAQEKNSLIEAYKDLMGIKTLSWEYVRSDKLPGFRNKYATVSSKRKFLNNVLYNLSEEVLTLQDIKIGNNYEFYFDNETDKQEFLEQIKEDLGEGLVSKLQDKDNPKQLWANVGLPHLTIYEGRDNFIGSHLVKQWMRRFPQLRIKRIFNKGNDLDFQNTFFKSSTGESFELTDLFTSQLYFRLSGEKNKDQQLNLYYKLKENYQSNFIDYIKSYFQNQTNYNKENYTELTTVIDDLLNYIENAKDFTQIESVLFNSCQKNYNQLPEKLDEKETKKEQKLRLEKKQNFIKEKIKDTLIEVCANFLYKQHQDDLHCLSKFGNSTPKTRRVIVVSDYALATNNEAAYERNSFITKEVIVDPSTIKNKINGVIMPKTFRSVLGLDDETTVGEILKDKDYFVKKLIKKDVCKLTNIELGWDEDNGQSFKYRTWDLCLKKNNGKHLYIKMVDDTTEASIINNNRFTEAYKIQEDAEGKFWAIHNKTGKIMYQVCNKEDRIFYDPLTGSDIILTQKCSLKNAKNKTLTIKENDFSLKEGQRIENNPYEFYLNNYQFNSFAVNSQRQPGWESTYITENSLTWYLLNEALSSNKEISKILPLTFEYKMKLFETLRDNGGKLPQNDVGTYILQQGRRLWQSFNKILYITAARIPAQSLQSVMPMRVADFIETDSNNALVSAYQFYLQGSDLDIDTVTIQTFALNDAGIFQTHTPYYNLDFDEASSFLPCKPEIKQITLSDEEGADINTIIDKYGIQINNLSKAEAKADFYEYLITKAKKLENENAQESAFISKLLEGMKSFKNDLLNIYKNNQDKSVNYIEKDGKLYQLFKNNKNHEDKDATISRFQLYKEYLRNIEDYDTLSKLNQYENYFQFGEKSDLSNKCFFIDGDKITLKLDSENRLKTFSELLNSITTNTIKKDNSINENIQKQICKYISRHFEYFHKLSKKNQQIAIANFETNNLFNIIVDTSHMSESLASIDVIVSPVKNEADLQPQATEGWYSTVMNSSNIHSGIEINMVGKDGIAICAVAEKHYFALMGAFQAILEKGDNELKKTLLAGLPSFIQDANNIEEIPNPIFNGRIANKKCHILCNAFSNKVKYIDNKNNIYSFQFTQENINDIDTLLANLVEQQKYNPDAALIISALLSLATDNAKELVLGKINAGLATIDLYLAGATVGLNIHQLMTIINSSYGQEIAKMATNNLFAGQTSFKVSDAVINFENVGSLIGRMFKNQKLSFKGLYKQPIDIINFLLARELYLKAEAYKKPSNKEEDEKEVTVKADNTTEDEQVKNEDTQEVVESPKISIKLNSNGQWYLDQGNDYDSENVLNNFKGWLKDPVKSYRDFMQKYHSNINIKDIYYDVINIVKKLYMHNIIPYTAYGLPGENTGFNNSEYTDENKNQINLQKDQILNLYLDRLLGCLRKHSNNFINDPVNGGYIIPVAFNKLALIADEFSRGSRLLINKEIPTDTAKKENIINNFEQVFINQINSLPIYVSNRKGIREIKEIFEKNPDDYIVFETVSENESIFKDQTFTGAKLNLYKFLYDSEYQKNCILLMDKLKIYYNILNTVSQLPHYKEYLGTLLASIQVEKTTLTNIIKKEFVNPRIKQWKVRVKKFKNEIYQKSQALTENLFIQEFFDRNKIIGTLNKPFKAYSNNQNLVDFDKLTINLSTDIGKENFIKYMNYLFEFLQSNNVLPNNKFITNLTRLPIIHTLHGNRIFAWSVNVDLNSKDENDKQLAEEIESYYLDLNNITLDTIDDIVTDIENKTQKKLNFNKLNLDRQLNIADLIYIYGLLVTNNQVSKTSITNIIHKQVSKDNSIAKAYYNFFATRSKELVKDYKKCIDQDTSNIISERLESSTQIQPFLNKLKALEEFITPILVFDTIEAGTNVRLKNKTLIDYYQQESKQFYYEPEDPTGPDYQPDYDNGPVLKTYPLVGRTKVNRSKSGNKFIYNQIMSGFSSDNNINMHLSLVGNDLTIVQNNSKFDLKNKISKKNVDTYIDIVNDFLKLNNFTELTKEEQKKLQTILTKNPIPGYCFLSSLISTNSSIIENGKLILDEDQLKGIKCD